MGNLLGCFLTNESRSRLPAPGAVVKASLIYLNKYVSQCVVSERKCRSSAELMDQARLMLMDLIMQMAGWTPELK